ncbi:MAG: hypothetical protein AAGH99_02685 [Planctomycetota bacterium]
MNEASKPENETAIDPTLAEVLAERDVACPSCGYNLRGLRAGGCPECGAGVTWEALLPSKAGMLGAGGAWWVIGLVALAVSLPESFLKWQRLAYRRLFFYGEQRWVYVPQGTSYYVQPEASWGNAWFVGSTLYWHLIPVMLGLWWFGRRRIARWPRGLRVALALLLLAAAVLGHRRLMFWYYLSGYGQYAPWPLWYID